MGDRTDAGADRRPDAAEGPPGAHKPDDQRADGLTPLAPHNLKRVPPVPKAVDPPAPQRLGLRAAPQAGEEEPEPETVRADRKALLRAFDLDDDDPQTVRASGVSAGPRVEERRRPGAPQPASLPRSPAPQPVLVPAPVSRAASAAVREVARPKPAKKRDDAETVQLSQLPASFLADAGLLDRPSRGDVGMGTDEVPPGPLPSPVLDRSSPALAKVEVAPPVRASEEGGWLPPTVLFPMIGGALGAAVLVAIILAFVAGSIGMSP